MDVLQQQNALLNEIQARIEVFEQEKDLPSSQALEQIESLINLLNEKISEDTTTEGLARYLILRARARNLQATSFHNLGRNDLAHQALAEAKQDLNAIPELQRNESFLFVQARNNELCGVMQWILRDYEGALATIDQAIGCYESLAKEPERFNALNTKAALYASTGEYAKAIELMLQAEKFFEKIGDRKKRAMLLHNLCGIYYESGQVDVALESISEAIQLLGEEPNRQTMELLNGRGLILLEVRKFQEAKADFKLALELSQKFEVIEEQIRAFSGIGRAELEQNRWDDALEAYNQALKLRTSARIRNPEQDVLKGVAYIYEQKGLWQNAKGYYKKMLSQAEIDRSDLYYSDALAGLSRVAEAEGDYETALELYKSFHRHAEKLAGKKSDEQFQRLKATFLADQARKESESLKTLNAQLFKAHDALSQIVSELELQKADLELQYSRIKELLASLSEGILIEDESRRAYFVNQKLLDLFNISGSPEDFIGKSADRLRALVRSRVQESDKARAYFEQCFYERKTERRKEVKQLNGKIYEFSFVPLFKQNYYRGCLWIFEDVTLRKNQELERELTIEKLNEANQKLHNVNKLKSDLIAIAIHDLKNPLNIIIGFSDLLLKEDQSESVRTYSESIKGSASRMLALVQDLLNSAKIEKEEFIALSPTSLNQIVRYVVANQEVLANEKRIKLELIELCECVVRAESNKLYEIIENLVSNAIKYSPRDKRVTITIEKLSVEQSRLRRKSDIERAKAGIARVSIKDEGQGLTEEDLKRLFQPFQKLSARPTAGEHSTGLGLYIVKSLVEKHHGKVWAESEGKGKGATFCLELPAIE